MQQNYNTLEAQPIKQLSLTSNASIQTFFIPEAGITVTVTTDIHPDGVRSTVNYLLPYRLHDQQTFNKSNLLQIHNSYTQQVNHQQQQIQPTSTSTYHAPPTQSVYQYPAEQQTTFDCDTTFARIKPRKRPRKPYTRRTAIIAPLALNPVTLDTNYLTTDLNDSATAAPILNIPLLATEQNIYQTAEIRDIFNQLTSLSATST